MKNYFCKAYSVIFSAFVKLFPYKTAKFFNGLQAHLFDISSIYLRYNFDIYSIKWIEEISIK